MLAKLRLDFIIEFLKEVIPEYEEMLVFIEKNDGHFKLPPEANALIERFKVDNYPELYRDEVQLMKMVMLSILPADEINALASEIVELNVDARTKALEDLASHFKQSSIGLLDSIPVTEGEKQAAQSAYDKMTPEEQSKAIQQVQIVLSGFIPTFFNIMSMMVHGVKLTDLVSAAETGDDEAFVLAVQIDKRILTLPYFKERRFRAEVEQELGFLKSLNYRLTNPLLRSRIRYKTLWLSFSVLDTAGYLDGSAGYSELLQALDTIGIAGYGNRISDESSLGKRVREYRKFQEINKKSRHSNTI